jgi:CubicO group peptidase (beta-lactamase class C family)
MRCLIALLLLAVPAAADPLDGIDAHVKAGLKAHSVPGLGLAVVKDGKVVLARGYGVREVGKPDPVTDKTVFAVGSVTKSFTAAALGILVDEGKLTWDTRLADRLPKFRLKDPYRTQQITVRDALAHRTGMERNELLWYRSGFTRDQVLGKLRLVDVDDEFRTRFRYNNMMFLAAGQLVPAVTESKATWDEFVADRLFKPLGMTSATTTITALSKGGDVATPHEKVKGVPRPVEWLNVDNCGPAGSVNASAADMAAYLLFQLSNGRGPGKRLVKADTVREMHAVHMPMGKPAFSFNPDALSRGYGLGWFVTDYKGRRLVEHGGNVDGMTAQVAFLPDEKLGVVILANQGQSLLPQALLFDILDRYLGDPAANRADTTGLLAWVNDYAVVQVTAADENARVKGTKASLPADKYAGKYQDNRHAPLRVTEADGKLTASFHTWTFTLDHWHYDTFRGTDTKGVLPPLLFTFVLGPDGRVSEVKPPAIGGAELTFKRQ